MHRYIGSVAVLVAAAVVLLAPAAGQAGGSPSIAWSGTANYGAVPVHQAASQTFTLTNSGGSGSGVLSVSLSGTGPAVFGIASDACTGVALGKGKSCAVTVQFVPAAHGESYSATLTATGKKSDAVASITLTGSGVGTPNIIVVPGGLSSVGANGVKNYVFDAGTSQSAFFTLINVGTGPSNQLQIQPGGGNGFFLASTNCQGQILAPAPNNNQCFFQLLASPPSCPEPAPFLSFWNVFGLPVSGPFDHYINLQVLRVCPPA